MLINFRKKVTVALFLLCMKVKEIHKYMQYEVSLTVCMDRTTNQRKVPKWLPFKNYKVRITKYFMCIYGGYMCICIPNMKFLCLTLCHGEVCTDNDANANDADANDRQSMIVSGALVDNQMSQKSVCTR